MSQSRVVLFERRPDFVGKLSRHTRLFCSRIGIPMHTSRPGQFSRKGTGDHALQGGVGIIPDVS